MVAFYIFRLLGLEVRCKVNSKNILTRFYFTCFTILYWSSAALVLATMKRTDDSTHFFFILLTISRAVCLSVLTFYHELHRITFHGIAGEEGLLMPKKSLNQVQNNKAGPNLVYLHLREHSFLRSKADTSNLYRIKLLEKVKLSFDSNKQEIRTFRAEVYLNSKKVNAVEKSYQDFNTFQTTLINFLRGTDCDIPTMDGLKMGGMVRDVGDSDFSTGSDGPSLSKQDELFKIKQYCELLSSNSDFQVGPFFNFFGVVPENLVEDNQNDSRRSTASLLGEENMDMGSIKWETYDKQDTQEYALYFSVRLEDYRKTEEGYYAFKFYLVSAIDSSRITLEKRYSDFDTLRKKMNSEVRIRTPYLPRKSMFNLDSVMKERGDELSSWLAIVLNERTYFCQTLFEFIGASSALQTSCLNHTHLSSQRSISCKLLGHSAVNDLEENFVIYNMKVEIFDIKTNERVTDWWVSRRFREFSSLESDLSHKFKNTKIDLPKCPSKLSFASVNKRQQDLDSFISALTYLPDIIETLSFRQFLEAKTDQLQLRPEASQRG